MSGFTYAPATVTVSPGDTVVFRNDDPVTHTVTASAFSSGDIAAGQVWRWVPNKSGRYAFRCVYHPNMLGTVIVQ